MDQCTDGARWRGNGRVSLLGGRKAGSAAAWSDGAACVDHPDQSLAAGSLSAGSSLAVAAVPFDFQGQSARTIAKASALWFATDACSVLDIGNVADVVNRLDDDEKGLNIIETLGGPQQLNTVDKSGLYSLICKVT